MRKAFLGSDGTTDQAGVGSRALFGRSAIERATGYPQAFVEVAGTGVVAVAGADGGVEVVAAGVSRLALRRS